MITAGPLVYLELQKTGGSHIRRLLTELVGGERDGKHNRIVEFSPEKHYVGSVRNPWDWYVSLWAYGASGQGAVRRRAVSRIDLDYYHRLLPKSMGKNWLSPTEFARSVWNDAVKPVSDWRRSYVDPQDVDCFRHWLRLMLDRRRRFDIGEGYGFSPLSSHSGLMTYRYFRLFTLGNTVYVSKDLRQQRQLEDFAKENVILRSTIRMESLETDFLEAISAAGIRLSAENIQNIWQHAEQKTNTSKRLPVTNYYDRDSADLVAEKERYVIEKFGYQSPV